MLIFWNKMFLLSEHPLPQTMQAGSTWNNDSRHGWAVFIPRAQTWSCLLCNVQAWLRQAKVCKAPQQRGSSNILSLGFKSKENTCAL